MGRPLRAPPTPQPPTGKIASLRRWRLVARLRKDLWDQWLTSYLAIQTQRTKWLKKKLQLKEGDLVYIKDETLKERTWPIARIIETMPGSDGQVRAVKLQCRDKRYIRAVTQLIPFSPDENEDDPAASAKPGSLSGTTQT